MKQASIPQNESARLANLHKYEILDTSLDQTYDQLTELASSVCNTPISLISLVDEKRQWFKSHHGLDVKETPREISFCAHAIHQDQIFEIKDTREDERFYDNPLVTGAPHIIFYAGAPLITSAGHRLGTLCVIDNKPSTLSDLQKNQLQIIAHQVVTQLELRKALSIQDDLLSRSLSLTNNLENKNKELDQFVYTVSHDLKSPLVSISGFVNSLNKELANSTNEKQKHRFNRVLENVAHMGELLTNLLHLSRVMNADITKASVDPAEIIEKSWQRQKKEHEELSVELIVEMPLCHIWANHTLLSQCIDNLLSNAIRYRDHQRNCEIRIYTKESNKFVSIFFQDNGLGIATDDQQRIFQIFEQVTPGKGNGVGLNIVKAATEKHGGSVNLTSELGKGSCFELRFPKS